MRYCFIHIPRTSGTSTIARLKHHFRLAPWGSFGEYANNWDKVHLFDLYGGHTNYSMKKYLPEDTVMMTMMRHPVERTISHWKFSTRQGSGHYYKGLWKGGMTLWDYINHPLISDVIYNLMTRYLGADIEIEDYMPNYNQLFETKYGLDNIDEVFERAMERLDELFFVGLQEEHVESLTRMFNLMGIDDKSSISAKNVPEKRHKLDKKVLERIEDLTTYDAALYAKARDIFYGQS